MKLGNENFQMNPMATDPGSLDSDIRNKISKQEVLAMLQANGPDHAETQKAMIRWTEQQEKWVDSQEDRNRARILSEIERSDLYVAAGDIEGALECLRLADWDANNQNLQDVRELILNKVAEIHNAKPVERTEQKEEYITLGLELSRNPEGFPFPGIRSESYAIIKREEEEYPGFATPIDELLERFKKEGLKVVMSNDPASGNIFILPKNSMDVENDNLFPRHLEITSDMNDKLKMLIRLQAIIFGGKK